MNRYNFTPDMPTVLVDSATATMTARMESSFTPTDEQSAFVSALLDTQDNLALVARAGVGKSTTAVYGAGEYSRAFPGREIVLVAYNKSAATDLTGKLTSSGLSSGAYSDPIRASTVHALGRGLMSKRFNPSNDPAWLDDKKTWHIIDDLSMAGGLSDPFRIFGGQINSLVSYGKQAGVGCSFADLPVDDTGTWRSLADRFDVDLDIDSAREMQTVARCCARVYQISVNQTDKIDFNDMILLPLWHRIPVRYAKDLVIGDEWQDLSPCRQKLIEKFVRPGGGRICLVGDPQQSIYGFAAADTDGMRRAIESFSCRTLPLTLTFRCPRSIVNEVIDYVPDFRCDDNAPDGRVVYQPALLRRTDESPAEPISICLDDLRPELDAILCRNTAPLISLAYKLIRTRIPARVEGRSIGEGLLSLIRRWKTRSTRELMDRISEWAEREQAKVHARAIEDKDRHGIGAKLESINEKVDCIREIVNEVNRAGSTKTSDVERYISDLFGDAPEGETLKGCVTLCTYHRAKGREWFRVILFEHSSRCPSGFARQEWQKEQEYNLEYVARTRVKRGADPVRDGVLVYVG